MCTIRDLPCFLRMEVEGKEILLVYHEGESATPCFNDEAIRIGFEVKAGQSIRARGEYRKEEDIVIISTCPSNDYYIEIEADSDRGH